MSFLKSSTIATICFLGFGAVPALASTVDTSACVSVSGPAGCKFDGNINGNFMASNVNSYLNAEAAYNAIRDPDITLNYLGDTDTSFPGTFTGAGGTSGTWSLPGSVVDFIAVKAGPSFILYQLATPASSGTWSTAGLTNKKGELQDLSHLVFFGMGGTPAVPEPATWAMMIGGIGLAGGIMRRKRSVATTVSFA